MAEVRALFENSGLSLHDLGLKMGYRPEIARQSVWQFMKTSDPRLSMLRRFATAMRVPVKDLVAEAASARRSTMKRVTAEQSAKFKVMNERIQRRYEFLTGGRLLPDKQHDQVLKLPLDWMATLANALDGADPKSRAYDQQPSSIVARILSEYEHSSPTA